MNHPAMPSWSAANQARLQIQTQCDYLRLALSLNPSMYETPGSVQTLREISAWIAVADDSAVLHAADQVFTGNFYLIKAFNDIVQPKRPWQLIADEFTRSLASGEISWSFGVKMEWLRNHFQLSGVRFPTDFPGHGVVGLADHSGLLMTEEQMLLDDAFFLVAKSRIAFARLNALSALEGKCDRRRLHVLARRTNMNCCGYARNAVSACFAFFECFLNSIGEDYLTRHPTTIAKDAEILRGKRGKRYVSLEGRLEGIPHIIRADGTHPIKISDPKQRQEPFRSFLTEVRDLRDSAAHFSISKKRIWMRPKDWLNKVDLASKLCIDASKAFWDACYPGRGGPEYLKNLSLDAWTRSGLKRGLAEVDHPDDLPDAALPDVSA